MHSEYIEQRHGAIFPPLKLAKLYGAIAFYLDHQAEREFEGNAIPLEQANPALWAKIQREGRGCQRVSGILEHPLPG